MKIKNPFHKAPAIRNPFRQTYMIPNVFKMDRPLSEISYAFFVLAIFFLPFDSFPIFPVSSTYRPISVLFLLICFVISVMRGKLRKPDFIISSFAILMGLHAFWGSFWYFQEYDHLTKTYITLLLFVIIVSSLNNVLHGLIKKNGLDWTLNLLTKILLISFGFLCIIGAIQFLAIIGVLPTGFARDITLLFTYRMNKGGRLQLVSGEPSMLVRNILTIVPFVYFLYKGKKKKLFLFLIAFFLMLSGSTYGYLVIVFFALFHLIFFHFTRSNVAKVMIYGLLFLLTMKAAYETFLPTYTQKKIDRVVEFVSDPNNLETIITIDGSIFARVMNPYIGFISAEHSNYLGLGLDNFRYVYPEYVLELFPFAAKHGSVRDVLEGENYITPKSLYARIFTELGVIPFFLYMCYLGYLFLRIRYLKKHSKELYNFTSVCFTLIVVFMISWDSIIYFNVLFLIVLITLILRFHSKAGSKLNNTEA